MFPVYGEQSEFGTTNNYRELVGDGKQVSIGGEARLLTYQKRVSAYGSIGAPTFEDAGFKELTEAEILDKAIYLDEQEAQLYHLIDFPAKDQNGLPYCWIYGTTGAVECVRKLQGLPYVELSPESAGGPITNYRSRGGYGEEGLKFGSQTGFASQDLWPRQRIGGPSNVTAEVKASYENHKIKEWFDCQTNNLRQLWTLLLAGHPCPLGLDWWGHLIYACGVAADRQKSQIVGTVIRNSHGRDAHSKNKHGVAGFLTLSPSKSRGDAFGIRSVTASTK